MSLAHTYAAVFREYARLGREDAPDILLAYMQKKGHLSLAPQVLRILEREATHQAHTTVLLAREGDAAHHRAEMQDALRRLEVSDTDRKVVIDDRLVGGFTVRTPSKMVDASIRSALINIYQNVLS